MTELARQIGVPLSTLHREVERLVETGIVRDRMVGHSRVLSANPESRLVPPLADLLALTYGPPAAIADEFEGLADVDLVLIFGSWAARYYGKAGPMANDVDVLVVGSPDRGAVYDAAERAQKRIGIEVNPTVCSRRRWAEAPDALVQEIKSSPFHVVVDNRSESAAEAPWRPTV
jgi:predicted nucleotidyltransferase